MPAQHVLDLERRYLLAPGLDDVDALASEDAVAVAPVPDGAVAGVEPAVAEGGGGLLGAAPVFAEQARSPHLDTALLPGEGLVAPVAPKAHAHGWEGIADVALGAGTVQRVGEHHAGLAEAVALEDDLAGDLPPAPVGLGGERGRARDHEARVAGGPADQFPALGGHALPRPDEAHVHGGHAHEDGDAQAREAAPDRIGVETREELDRGTLPERAQQGVDDAVHMVQGEGVQNPVAARDFPGPGDALDLVSGGGVGGDHALGLPGGAAGVDDVRGARFGDDREGRRVGHGREQVGETRAGRTPEGIDDVGPRDAARLRRRHRLLFRARVQEHQLRVGVLDEGHQLRDRMRQRQRDHHAPRAPGAPLRGDVREAGGRQEDDAGLLEVGASAQEKVRHPFGHGEQVAVAAFRFADHQGNPVGMGPGGTQKREVGIAHAAVLAWRVRLVSSHQR